MQSFLEYGLSNAAMATLFAVAALAVGIAVRRPAVRNALWILVLLRLIVPPVWVYRWHGLPLRSHFPRLSRQCRNRTRHSIPTMRLGHFP